MFQTGVICWTDFYGRYQNYQIQKPNFRWLPVAELLWIQSNKWPFVRLKMEKSPDFGYQVRKSESRKVRSDKADVSLFFMKKPVEGKKENLDVCYL
jgi:hypothetical protein